MPNDLPEAVNTLVEELRRANHIGSALSLLGWDQETQMPAQGAAPRADMIGALTEVHHARATSESMGDKIAAAEDEVRGGDPRLVALVREAKRDWQRARKIPSDLAQEVAVTCSRSLMAWRSARAGNDFKTFEPQLKLVVALKRRVAEALREGDGSLYDTLLDEYEPGITGAQFQAFCDAVKPRLVQLVAEAAPRCQELRTDFVTAGYDSDRQLEFSREILESMGYDFTRGRLDLTVHPFCTGISSPNDVRITTRVDPKDFTHNLFSVIHEGGHALYEQGLDPEWSGTPLGAATSLGIHESQSRLYENVYGRSDAFWVHWLPRFRAAFPGRADDVTHEQFVAAVNCVRPSLIRTEADEVTYSLHVMLRFELEHALIEGNIEVEELPDRWNRLMRELLGVEPTSDAEGVLQDIHWSMGAYGYFPTYFLGNLYGAQIDRAARQAMPDLDEQLARGEMLPLREWLGEKVHMKGRQFSSLDLVEEVSGDPLDPLGFVEYLEEKVARLFPA